MSQYLSVLHDACQLTDVERLQLIDALWGTLPACTDILLNEASGSELERRVAQIESGTPTTVSWDAICSGV